jgi:hypothetical protein
MVYFSGELYAGDKYAERYDLLYHDLINWGKYGYKSSLYDKSDDFQGVLQQTDAPLNMAIAGKGFFKVKKNSKIFYTRNGSFEYKQGGELVNDDGYELIISGALPDDIINIGDKVINNTLIVVSRDNSTVYHEKIILYTIDYLNSVNDGVYFESAISSIDSESKIISGHVEASNCWLLPLLIEMKFILDIISTDNDDFKCVQSKTELINHLLLHLYAGRKAEDINYFTPFQHFKYLNRRYEPLSK